MKIAQLAPIAERVPPRKYGGTERIIHALTEELVRRGHEVTLFASGDSESSARLEAVFPRSLREANLRDIYGVNPWTLLNIGMCYDMQDEFDVIHDHLAPVSLPTANIATTPTLMTMHNPFNRANLKLFQTFNSPHVATISRAQLHSAININHAGTVYNGLPMRHYPFQKDRDDYLLFVGRIAIDKGVHHAIDVAEQLDMPLVIAAKLEKPDQAYFREYVEPRLTKRIQWIGEVEEKERNDLMSKARCYLHPGMWREPFGLVLIEAAACGCPVVALEKGSIPEIIKHGVTGFVVQDVEGMVEAVESIDSVKGEECRKYVLENFNEKKMADGYEEIYKKIVAR